MHYRFTRTATPSDLEGARAFAAQVTEYLKVNHAMEVEWGIHAFSDNRIVWTTTFDTLGEWEERQMKLMADQSYQQLIAASAEHYVPGTVQDTLTVIMD